MVFFHGRQNIEEAGNKDKKKIYYLRSSDGVFQKALHKSQALLKILHGQATVKWGYLD